MAEKIAVVANIHSLFHASKKFLGAPVNYPLLMNDIRRGRDVIESIACVIRNPKGQDKFLLNLQSVGFVIDVSQDDNSLCDSYMNAMVRLSTLVNTLVLITTDQAVVPIIDYLDMTNRLPRIEVWSFRGDKDGDLSDVADAVRMVDEKYIYQPSGA